MRIQRAVVAHAVDEGGLVPVPHEALEGQRLQAGQLIFQEQAAVVEIELLPVHLRGGEEQALQAENDVAVISQALADLVEDDPGARVETLSGFPFMLFRHQPMGQQRQRQANREQDCRQRKRRQRPVCECRADTGHGGRI
ncbi:hypothetical protein MASR1M97_02530 [Candidatus Desulfobacillus denitrificans]